MDRLGSWYRLLCQVQYFILHCDTSATVAAIVYKIEIPNGDGRCTNTPSLSDFHHTSIK